MSRRGLRMMGSALAAMLAGLSSSVSPIPQYRKHDPDNKPVHDRVASRYMPHQGDREKARRRRQMLKAYGKNPVVRFYASLSGGEV